MSSSVADDSFKSLSKPAYGSESTNPSCSAARILTHRTIDNVPPDTWNRLTGNNPFASHGWLLGVERCWRARFQPLYFTLEHGDEILAAAAAYLVEPGSLTETLDDLLLGRVKVPASRVGVGFLPALVCGPVQGYGWHIGLEPSLDRGAHRECLNMMLDALETEADNRGLNLSFTLVLNEEKDLVEVLESRGYLSCVDVPVAAMDVAWSSFEEYLTCLPSKRRREYQRQRRRYAETSSRVELLAGGGPDYARCVALLDANARNHGASGIVFNDRILAELRDSMGEDALIFVSRNNGEIAAALLAMKLNDVMVAYIVGVETSPKDEYTYFEIVYNALVEFAIRNRIRRIYYGRGMYGIKLRRGCSLIQASTYTRVRYPGRFLYRIWYAIASFWNRYKFVPELRRVNTSLKSGFGGKGD